MGDPGSIPAIWAIAIFGSVWTLLTTLGAWILVDIKRSIKENEGRASKTRHDVRDSMHRMELQSTELKTKFGVVEKNVDQLNVAIASQQSRSLAVEAASAVVAALNNNHQLVAPHSGEPSHQTAPGSSFR